MSAPDLRIVNALMKQAREVLHDDSLSPLIIGGDRAVLPYHLDAGGSRRVELRWDGTTWQIQRDGCGLCLGLMLAGAAGEFRVLQRMLYEHEQQEDSDGAEARRRV